MNHIIACNERRLCLQGRSQEFANGGQKRRSGGRKPPTGSRGTAPVGSGAKPPRSRRHMLNIWQNIAIGPHKSRTVQSPIILLKHFQLRRGWGHAPISPLGYATVCLLFRWARVNWILVILWWRFIVYGDVITNGRHWRWRVNTTRTRSM